ncbi:hypothetical protein CEP51_003390 [Fusarium floridanum]|uniref:DEAD-box helicase OB fold domain-containing protein n=1 Tax=Fusarium floridanum TaxID=1325733 RepID=A0A428S6J1_9HYPO|nr:hypothetical protein CEP51_003390 [Fusarium floridanum]
MNFEDKQYTNKICKEMARSLFYNTGLPRSREQGSKWKWPRTVHRNHHAALHPGSALIDIKHEWVIFNKFVNSWSRQYLQSITAIKPEWIIDLPYFEDKMLLRKRSEALRQPYVKRSLDQAREKTVTAIEPEWIIDIPYFQNEKLARKGNGALRQPHVKESLERWQIPNLGGTWSEDLGEKAKKGTGQPEPEPEPEPTSNKKRKRTEEADSQPPAQRRCRKNVRRCTDKAYLGIIWNKTLGEPKWTWKASSGQAANGESVNLRHGLDLYAWKDRCLTNYDIPERRLTRIYNRDLVVASARMRIVKWAEEGAAPNRTPSIYAESCPKLRARLDGSQSEGVLCDHGRAHGQVE